MITPIVALKLTATIENANLQTGGPAVYQLTVVNHGPSATSGTTTVSDPLPAGMSFVSAGGSGWTCAESGGTVTCTTPQSIANGATSMITLLTRVTAGPGRIVNTATVVSAMQQTSGAADSASVTGVVAPSPLAATGAPTRTPLYFGMLLLGLGLMFMIIARRRTT